MNATCRGTDRTAGKVGCKGMDTPCREGRCSNSHCHEASGQLAVCASRKLKQLASIHSWMALACHACTGLHMTCCVQCSGRTGGREM